MFLNLHGGEIVILIIAALVILGPQRLPGYAAKLAQGVRHLRDMAEGAKGQIKNELGPGFDDIDWRQLDPRQYDPRRIVREALSTPSPGDRGTARQATAAAGPRSATEAGGSGDGARGPAGGGRRGIGPVGPGVMDPDLPTPFDPEAT